MNVAALDLGGTRCKAARVRVPGDGPPTVVTALEPVDVAGLGAERALAVAVEQVQAMDEVDAVGVALPGLHDEGLVVALPGKFPGMEGIDVRVRLGNLTGRRVHSSNDAVAAAVGEAVAGAAAGATTALVVTIGTGVGTAVVVDGVPVGRGPLAGGTLGGHIPISAAEGPLDTAGNRGTIEARCRADRILGEANDAGCDATTVAEVMDLAADGDTAALAGIRSWQRWFLRGLVALAHAHAPDVVVVGGGPVRDGTILLDGLDDQLRAATWPGFEPQLRPAALGDLAGLVGIAHLTGRALA